MHEAFAVTLSHTEASVAALRRKALLCLVKIDVWEADHVSATWRIIMAYFRNSINMIYEIISCFIELICSSVFCGWPWFFYLSQFWFRPLKGYFTQSWKFCHNLCTLISQTFMAFFFFIHGTWFCLPVFVHTLKINRFQNNIWHFSTKKKSSLCSTKSKIVHEGEKRKTDCHF